MGSCAVGAAIVMSGVLLAQIEESEDDLKLTKEEGSWFGMVYIFQNISRYYIFHTPLTRPILLDLYWNYFYYLILYPVLLRNLTFNIMASH